MKYFRFSNISDLIDQFNYVGFHDVCIYPAVGQLSPNKYPDSYPDSQYPYLCESRHLGFITCKYPDSKGVKYVFGGYMEHNQTGIE